MVFSLLGSEKGVSPLIGQTPAPWICWTCKTCVRSWKFLLEGLSLWGKLKRTRPLKTTIKAINIHNSARQKEMLFKRGNAISTAPHWTGKKKLPLEMENDLTVRSPQRTVCASRPAYSSPGKISQWYYYAFPYAFNCDYVYCSFEWIFLWHHECTIVIFVIFFVDPPSEIGSIWCICNSLYIVLSNSEKYSGLLQ